MRLLSFLTQVEATLAVLRPEDGAGWRRRVDYQSGEAVAWHPRLGLSLHLRLSLVTQDRHGLHARWSADSGEVLEERTFFCGPSGFEWQAAAEALAELAPAAALPPLLAERRETLAAQA